MEYLTVKEVAELKGCSVRYVQNCVSKGKLQAVQEYSSQNNCLQYMIPISALSVELKERYYNVSHLKVVPARAEMSPAVKQHTKIVKIKRGIETFSAEEVIAFAASDFSFVRLVT